MRAYVRGAAVAVIGLCVGLMAGGPEARAEAALLIEADTGRVLYAENAAAPWYPASVTKIMTAYVTLRAIKEGRLKFDTLLTVSANALAQQPSKMGFPVGTKVTVDDALKMMMVKSANDIAVVLAEGVSGSVEKFADEMNQAGNRLGMTQSSWVNPNGLPAENQVTSARDMAILARTVLREFPEHELYWRIPAIKFGKRVMRNYNKLIDRYPGADGMKTGFICASGFNLVASASRNGRRLIAVVLGSPSAKERSEKAAQMLERGFSSGTGLAWLVPSLGTVDAIRPIAAAPPNLREEICGKNRKRPRTDHGEEEEQPGLQVDAASAAYAALMPNFRAGGGASLLGTLTPSMPPIVVRAVPPAGVTAEAIEGTGPKPKPRKGRKSATIAVTPAADKDKDAASKPAASKPAASKPARTKPAAARNKPAAPGATPAPGPKPAATAKPSAPKPAAKPPVPAAAAKPAGAAATRKPAAKPAASSSASAN